MTLDGTTQAQRERVAFALYGRENVVRVLRPLNAQAFYVETRDGAEHMVSVFNDRVAETFWRDAQAVAR